MITVDVRNEHPEYLRGYLYKKEVLLINWELVSKEHLDYVINVIIRPQRCVYFLSTPLIKELL